MSALKKYLDRKNAYATIFGAKALTLDSAVDRQKIADVQLTVKRLPIQLIVT